MQTHLAFDSQQKKTRRAHACACLNWNKKIAFIDDVEALLCPPRVACAQTSVFHRAPRYIEAFFAVHVRDVEGVSVGLLDVPLRLGLITIVPQLQMWKGEAWLCKGALVWATMRTCHALLRTIMMAPLASEACSTVKYWPGAFRFSMTYLRPESYCW